MASGNSASEQTRHHARRSCASKALSGLYMEIHLVDGSKSPMKTVTSNAKPGESALNDSAGGPMACDHVLSSNVKGVMKRADRAHFLIEREIRHEFDVGVVEFVAKKVRIFGLANGNIAEEIEQVSHAVSRQRLPHVAG